MKFILTILFLNSVAFAQTNRYVSNSGSDANTGTLVSPYATIYKALSVAVSGDSILLSKGSTFQGNYTITTNSLKFNSYGSGVNPVITALQTKSGFTNVSGNIWTATADSAVSGLNLVYLKGSIAHKGRFPNVGWSTFTGSTDSTINTTLSGNNAGYGLAVRTAPWIIDLVTIKAQSGGLLSFSPKLTYPTMYGGNGYFLQNHPSLVDTVGEYYYNDTTKLLTVYSIGTPTVQIATRDTLIRLNHLTSASFSNIQFSGANAETIYSDSCNHIYITNCNFNSGGRNAFSGNSIGSQFNYDTVFNFLNSGIEISNGYDYCDSNQVTNCYFKNIGYMAGMGRSGVQMNGLSVYGNNSLTQYNRFDSIGYMPIHFSGRFGKILYNYISNFGFVTSDCGAIYSAIGVDSIQLANRSDSGTVIRGNVIENGIGANAGTNITAFAAGIYLDENVSYVLLDSNSIYNTYGAGIFFHNVNHNIATNNNIYGGANASCFVISGPSSITNSNTFKHNRTFASGGKYITYRDYSNNNESVDSNYISRFPTEGNYMYDFNYALDLTTWKGGTGWDIHSQTTPNDVTYDPVLYYSNPTKIGLTINIGATYKDFFNNSANSFTLAPYSSIILFKALNQIQPVVPPGKTATNYLPIKIRQK